MSVFADSAGVSLQADSAIEALPGCKGAVDLNPGDAYVLTGVTFELPGERAGIRD